MNKIVGIIMSGFLGLFSSVKHLELGAERSVDLGVATLHFSMQEDFSRDMPAQPLIEQVDVRQKEILRKLEGGLILQRWWDIKETGFFGKNLGMLMMSVGIHKVPENQKKLVHDRPYNIFDRLDLMLALNERFHQMYDDHNKQAVASGNDEFVYHGAPLLNGLRGSYTTPFRDDVVNQTKWISYSVVPASLNGELIVAHALPLTTDSMLELRFTYSPDKSKTTALEFYENVGEERVAPMFNSFVLEFNKEASEVKALVQGQWLSQTNNDVMANHLELLQEKFPPGEKIEYIAPPIE